MKPAPRPAARVLLAGRFLVSRTSLLALPDGPVVGVDLSCGASVSLTLGALGDTDALALCSARWRAAGLTGQPVVRDVRAHLTRVVVACDPPVAALAPVPSADRPARRGSVRRELASRRARVTIIVGGGLASALVASSLVGGSRHVDAVARAAGVRPAVVAPRVMPTTAHPATRTRVHVLAAPPGPAARGGAARLLASVAPRRPSARPVVRQAPRRTAERSSGWVAGLVVGP